MVDFPKFVATAAELYALWPWLFKGALGLIVPFLGALVTATWWMRGYKAEAAEAVLEEQKAKLATEKAELTTQITLLKGQLETQATALNGTLEALRIKTEGEIAILNQRLELANQQSNAAKEEAERLKTRLGELKDRLDQQAEEKGLQEFQLSTNLLGDSIENLVSANSAVSNTLTSIPKLSEKIVIPDYAKIRILGAPVFTREVEVVGAEKPTSPIPHN